MDLVDPAVWKGLGVLLDREVSERRFFSTEDCVRAGEDCVRVGEDCVRAGRFKQTEVIETQTQEVWSYEVCPTYSMLPCSHMYGNMPGIVLMPILLRMFS